METPKINTNNNFFWIFLISIFIIILSNVYLYYFKKDFNILIEASCDPSIETCFQRSCENGECPPNNYEHYRSYSLKGYLFESCQLDNCESFCKNTNSCIENVCEPEKGDSCSSK